MIINIASILSRRAGPRLGGYCASKAALERMSEALRLELKPFNVRVSNLYPGVTDTTFDDSALGEPPGRGPRVGATSPDRVGRAVLRVLRAEPRDAFVTLFDRAFVGAAAAAPGLLDMLMRTLFGGDGIRPEGCDGRSAARNQTTPEWPMARRQAPPGGQESSGMIGE
jgi:short-subunit dehydrogenase